MSIRAPRTPGYGQEYSSRQYGLLFSDSEAAILRFVNVRSELQLSSFYNHQSPSETSGAGSNLSGF